MNSIQLCVSGKESEVFSSELRTRKERGINVLMQTHKQTNKQTQFSHPSEPLIEDCTKDGGEEFFTEMHCVRITNCSRFYRNSIKGRSASR